MAQFNEILEGRLNQLIQKRLGMQSGAPSPTVSPEIMPVLVLENDRPEWAYQREERFYSALISAAAAAAEESWINIANPVNSGVVCTIEGASLEFANNPVLATPVQATSSLLGPGATVAVATQGIRWNGTRPNTGGALATNATPIAIVSGSDAGVTAAITPTMRFITSGVNPIAQTGPIVLYPGSRWLLVADTDNTLLIASFYYRLRALAGGELV